MSRPRFLIDNDVKRAIVAGLRRREPTLVLVELKDIGLADRPDSEVLEYASTNRLIVVSHDVNTMSAAAYERISAGTAMSGLFLVHQHHRVSATIDDLVLIWAVSEAEEWENRVTFL